MTDTQDLIKRLLWITYDLCTCGSVSSDIQTHHPICTYRTVHEAADALAAHEWKPMVCDFPYDKPVLIINEAGNVWQDVLYDQDLIDFMKKTKAIGWMNIPPLPPKED